MCDGSTGGITGGLWYMATDWVGLGLDTDTDCVGLGWVGLGNASGCAKCNVHTLVISE